MSTSATHRPVNLASVRWMDAGRIAAFRASRPGYGVEEIATGRLLSSDGVRPSVWSSKSIASVIAQYPPGVRNDPALQGGTVMSTTRISVPTSALRVGDIVLHYGMRVEITEPLTEHDHGDAATVYTTTGKVLNPHDEVVRRLAGAFVNEANGYTWDIQGTDAGTWSVSRAATQGARS